MSCVFPGVPEVLAKLFWPVIILIKEDLPNLFYSYCLLRICYHIHSLHSAQPTVPILISKCDIKLAYRCGTMRGCLAAQSITFLCGFTLLLRCLPFGGTYYPSLWCVVSEFITDLANDILSCSNWDENKLFSPHVLKLKEHTLLPDSIPFSPALPADIVVPPDVWGKVDDFIDGLVLVVTCPLIGVSLVE